MGYSKANDSSVESDRDAAYRAMQFDLGWFAHPIFSSYGNYPFVMEKRIKERSLQQNLTKSRLEPLTPQEIKDLLGNIDTRAAHCCIT